MSKLIKTRKEWFETLNEPYRTQAINNTLSLNVNGENLLNHKKGSLKIALTQGFAWNKSPQGGEYWKELHDNS